MKLLLILLCLCSNISMHGKVRDSVLHRINFQVHTGAFLPTGQFSTKYSDSYFLGQAKAGVNFNPSVIARVHKNFHAGIYVNISNFTLNEHKVAEQLRQHFMETEYYTTVNVATGNRSMTSGGFECTYKFRFSFCDIEPYIDLGIAGLNGSGDYWYSPASVYKKKKNDNYYEDIRISLNRSSLFFYPAIGIRIDKKIHKIFYLTLGLQYNYGETGYNLIYDKTNFFGNTSSTSVRYNLHISALQIQSGIQLRVFKARRFRHK